MWWTVNGHTYPEVPMYMVSTGDVVTMTLANGSGEVHPMHLHGHHAVVLSRDGVAATGSPWWFDSLDVEDGATYEIAFLADNPGIWVDHCHNLQHAVPGRRQSWQPARVGSAGESTPQRGSHSGLTLAVRLLRHVPGRAARRQHRRHLRAVGGVDKTLPLPGR